MKLIETKTLGAAAASIQFTSIPQTYTDLLVTYSLRTDRSSLLDSVQLIINGTTSGYSERNLNGNGSGAGSGSDTTSPYFLPSSAPAATSTSNVFNNGQITMVNYSGSTNKVLSVDAVSEDNATTGAAQQILKAMLWNNTAAITTITFNLLSPRNFVAGTTVSLYGVLKGSDGITAAY